MIIRDKYYDVLANLEKNNFGNTLSIYPVEDSQIQKIFNFLKLSHLSSIIHFLSHDVIKTSNLSPAKVRFLLRKT